MIDSPLNSGIPTAGSFSCSRVVSLHAIVASSSSGQAFPFHPAWDTCIFEVLVSRLGSLSLKVLRACKRLLNATPNTVFVAYQNISACISISEYSASRLAHVTTSNCSTASPFVTSLDLRSYPIIELGFSIALMQNAESSIWLLQLFDAIGC